MNLGKMPQEKLGKILVFILAASRLNSKVYFFTDAVTDNIEFTLVTHKTQNWLSMERPESSLSYFLTLP